MITGKKIDSLVCELKKGPNQKIRDEFNLETIRYFMQELKKINSASSAEELRKFYLSFEFRKDDNIDNYLDDKIIDLYLSIGDKPSEKKKNELLKKAEGFLKEIKKGTF